jgi:hypothetical protein
MLGRWAHLLVTSKQFCPVTAGCMGAPARQVSAASMPCCLMEQTTAAYSSRTPSHPKPRSLSLTWARGHSSKAVASPASILVACSFRQLLHRQKHMTQSPPLLCTALLQPGTERLPQLLARLQTVLWSVMRPAAGHHSSFGCTSCTGSSTTLVPVGARLLARRWQRNRQWTRHMHEHSSVAAQLVHYSFCSGRQLHGLHAAEGTAFKHAGLTMSASHTTMQMMFCTMCRWEVGDKDRVASVSPAGGTSHRPRRIPFDSERGTMRGSSSPYSQTCSHAADCLSLSAVHAGAKPTHALTVWRACICNHSLQLS